MIDDFHLTPLAANADAADLLEALGPLDERSGRNRSSASSAAAANDSACRCWTSKKSWTGRC